MSSFPSYGGTLEDCYTNIFALTEINGLQWKCFQTSSNVPRGIPTTSDPVLQSYSKCLKESIMCVWRRKPLSPSNNGETLPVPSLNGDIKKELWVFWYSEVPEKLADICSELDEDQEAGSEANTSNSVSYEVRVLYFKALHVLLERQMMQIGYVRFGRWFAKPQRGKRKEIHHTHYTSIIAMNFHFFVHGGNTICCAVKTQRQPTLIKLQKRHLEYDSMKRRISVLIGPWSLRGYLVRNQLTLLAEPRMASKAEKQFAEWKDFLQCDIEEDKDVEEEEDDEYFSVESEKDVPKMVLIEIDGIRMLVPSRYVCLTLDDERLVWDALGVKVTTVPEELAIPGGILPRNKFVTTAANAFAATKGGFESAMYDSVPRNPIQPIITSGGFAHPFPTVDENMLKWNFHDERHLNCKRPNCTMCKFMKRRELAGGKPLLDREEYTSVREELERKSVQKPDKRAYHRIRNAKTAKMIMIKEKQQQDAGPLPAQEFVHEYLWQANHHVFYDKPKWCQIATDNIQTGIYVNTEGSNNHHVFSSNTNSSDEEESTTWSPFTPIRVCYFDVAISPCTDCEWPAIPADQMTETVFNSIFHTNKTVRLPPNATQEDKSREFDSYYNPTLTSLRAIPEYAAYHNKRRGEKRKSTYPPNIRVPGDDELTSSSRLDNPMGSVEEPGSQDTIPAKSSPDEEVEDVREEDEEGVVKVVHVEKKQDERSKLLDYLNIKDEPMKRRRKKKQKKCLSVPDISLLEMALDNEPLKEEMGPQLENYPGRVSPAYSASPVYPQPSDEASSMFPEYADEKNENRALGEGTSVHFTDDSVMEVDSGPHEKSSSTSSSDQSTRLAETYGHDSILSPPASNEMARGGPPSVGDTMCPKGPPSVEASMAAAMNQIYPTPPSVQTELQQFSPATMMSQSLISTSIGSVPMVQTPLAFSAPFSVIQNTDEMMDFTCSTSSNSVADKKSQQKKEEVKEEETDDYDSYESIEKMKERVSNKEVVDLMSKISMGPLKSSQRKILMPPSKRFSGASQANAESITIRRVISTPPKYPKMLETARRAESKVGSRPGSATIIRNPKDAPLDMKEVAAVAAWHAQQPHQFTSGGQMSGYGGMPHPSHHNNMQQFQHQVPYPGMTPQQHYQYQQQQQQQMMMGQQQQHHMGGFQPSTPMNQHQMMGGGPGGPGYPPMGQYRQPGQYGPGMHMGMMQPPQQQQQQQMHQMYGQQMRNPMMGGPQGMNRGQLPPPYGAPSASGPGNYYGSQYGNYPAQTSVQQLNNFVNQPRFGGATPGPGMPGLGGGPPYGSMTGQHNQMNQFGSSPYSMDQQNQFNPMRQLPYSQQTPMGMGMQQQRMGMPLQMGPQSMGRTPTSSAIALNTPQHKEPQVPEGESVVLAIVLSDTILDLHYDSFLDACPICSCNVSIRARELGTYLTPHNSLRTGAYPNPRDHDTGNWSGFYVNGMQTQCTCGFSSIRHRYLSFAAGLFPEDSKEATALENSVMNVVTNIDGGYQAGVQSKNMTWFDSSSVADLALVDQIRQLAQVHSYGKAIGHMASLFEMAEKVTKASGISMDMTMATEYLVSEVDMMELQKIGHSAIDLSMQGLAINRNSSANTFLTYFHPWGLQNANEMRDPISLETKYALEVVTPALENAIRIARSISQPGGVNIVEGPLTWKQFVLKTQKSRNSAEPQEDDQYLAEPIPAVIAATERESIRAAPLIRQLAETTTLPPIDQPKDVLYLAIVPDSDVAVEKMARFMDRLSDHYERQRLGRHVAFPIQMHPDACRMHEQYIYQQQQRQQQEVADNQKMQKMMQEQMMNDPLMGGSSAMLGPSSSYQEPMETDSVQQPRDVAVDEATNPMVDTASAAPKWVQPSTTPLFMEPWPFDEEVPHRADTMEDVKNIPTNPAPFSEPARDGILRAGGKARIHSKYAAQNVANSIEFANMTRAVNDNYGFITRLKIFIQQFEDQVTALLVETPNVFERQTFRVQMAQEMKNKKCQQAAHAAFVKDKHSDQVDESRECGSTTPPPTGGKSVSPSEMATGDESSPLPPRSTSQPTLHDLLSEPSSTLSQSGGSQQQQQQSQQPTTSQVPRVPLMPEPLELEEIPYDEPGTLPHVIVLYVANPFTWGRENHSPLLMRVSIMAIVRTFNSILFKLPMKRRPQVQLEIIGLDQLEDHGLSVVDYLNDPRIPSDLTSRKGNTNYNDHICRDPPSQISPDYTPVEQIIKALSVAVYTHPRILNPDAYKSIQPRCMTSFGPGSSLLQTVEYLEAANRDAARMGKSFPYAFKVPSNIMYLAPPPYAYQKSENSKVLVSPSVEETALYVTYCLAGGDFLLATVTDGQGKLIDNCVINMKPRVEPNHTFKYKQRTQILDAMGRLWSFILGVMASDVKNWRLVVGRLGRIGHGEYRAWAHLLSKTSLQRYSTRLKEICLACNQMPGVLGTPAILSACLVTTEPEPNVRFFYDYVEKETNTKKSKQIVAPEDISCTHIVTFPVGAEINYDTQDASADDTKNEENWDFGDLDLGNDFEDGMKDIIKDVTETDTTELGSSSRVGMHSFFNDDANVDYQNQPLASGFYFSTAPAVDLPDWFWSSCPSRKRSIPVHLKSSLHINVPEIKNDDIMESAPNKDKDRPDQREPHPLESHQTEEVLRHVLETYNALSWLNVDPITGKRYSCLPIHMQHLLRLYHSIVRLLM